MRITRRRSTFGLFATTAVVMAPNVLRAKTKEILLPPDIAEVTWDQRTPDTRAVGYNIRTEKVPNLRARCQSEDAVKRVFDWARKTEKLFSVQSGGHCFEGLSQHDDLIIDLSSFTKTGITSDGNLTACPGTRLWQANDAAAEIGKALPAGYCQHVALGGHVGGGGIGLLSRQFGLTSDNLISARILTADGTLTTVNEETKPDLYWALRGGGSGGFGIVTEFQLKLHVVERAALAEHSWLIPKAQAAEFLYQAQTASLKLDQRVSPYFYVKARSKDTILARLRLASFAGEKVARAASKVFEKLSAQLTETQLVTGTYPEVADMMWPRDYNPRTWVKNKSLFLDQPLAEDVWAPVIDTLTMNADEETWISFEILGGEIDALGRSETAFVHRRGPKFLLGIGAFSKDGLTSMSRAFHFLQSVAVPGTYVNYPDLELSDWPRAYWQENVERLARVKRSVDPKNVFRHAQTIQPN